MPVFNQSYMAYMAQSEEPDRKKRARFSKVDGDFLAKIRIESVPAATKRSSSCHRVLYLAGQGWASNIELKEVAGSNRERFQKVYTWTLTVDGKPCQKSSILG